MNSDVFGPNEGSSGCIVPVGTDSPEQVQRSHETNNAPTQDPNLAWVYFSPLDDAVQYIICSYPARRATCVVEADTGKEVWFHLDIALRRFADAIVEKNTFCDAVESPGTGPINFPTGCASAMQHQLFVAVFDTFTKYQPVRYASRVACYFDEYGAVDNHAPSERPWRHLADLVAFARKGVH